MNFETNKDGGLIIPDNTRIDFNVSAFSEIGNGCEIGDGCKIEGVKCLDFMTLSNVDGSGRQIILIKHSDGIIVRAGCFVGDISAFIEKAKSENKMKYVSIVGAIAEVM